jgi:hypothetical protein
MIPRLVDRVWRRSCDEIIAENRGMYCYKSGTVVQIFFFELTSAIAKAKIAVIKGKIPQLLQSARTDESVLDAPLPAAAKPAQQAPKEGSQDLAKLVRDGMPENPTIEIVKLWLGRTMQEMVTASQKIPLTRAMIDVAGKSDITYLPLWNVAAQAIVGSHARVRTALPAQQWKTGESIRQDMAVLFAALFQLYTMHAKGVNGIAVVPVRVSTLADKDASELYMGLLRRVSAEVRKNLLIEVCNVPKETAPPSLVAAVETISQFARAFVFETGLLSFSAYGKQFPKLHACGYDSGDAHLNDAEQARLMKKYADHYGGAGVKVFAKNVTSPQIVETAVQSGFTYISGPAVRPAQKACFPVQKLALAELKKA